MPALLTKDDAPVNVTSTHVIVTMSWEASTSDGGWRGKVAKFRGTNLDNVGILMQRDRPVNYAGLDNLNPEEGVSHTGDTRGKKPETLTLTLGQVPEYISAVLITAVAHQAGESFRNAKNVKVKISADQEYMVQPSIVGHDNFLAVARLTRTPGGWQLSVVDEHRSYTQGDRDALVLAAMGM